METHSSMLAWKIPWTEEPGGLQFQGVARVRHDLAAKPPPLWESVQDRADGRVLTGWGGSQARLLQACWSLCFSSLKREQCSHPTERGDRRCAQGPAQRGTRRREHAGV